MADPAIDEEEAQPRFLLTGPGSEPLQADAVVAVLDQLQPAGVIVRGGWDRGVLDVVRKQGAALLVEDNIDPEADGVHLTEPGRVAEIRKKFDCHTQDRLILGADTGLSRHDAMVAGEAGADYVAFGERGKAADQAVADLITWWREVTVVPCLGYAGDVEGVACLARIGTDFIGVEDAVWNHPDGPVTAAEQLCKAIEKT